MSHKNEGGRPATMESWDEQRVQKEATKKQAARG